LANVAVAALIALLAAGASLIRSRPALAHALWLLVLLKLLTPPLWGVHIDRAWVRAIEPAARISRPAAVETSAAYDEQITETLPPIDSVDSSPVETEPVFANPRAGEISPLPIASPPVSNRFTKHALVVWLPTVATLLWAVGSAVCAGLIVLRVVRFHRLLRFATLASPALQGRAAALARRMGLARAPRVWFVPGVVCPMLWPLGRGARVLIPNELWDRLGEGQRLSLLAHELAHLRRRDHWVRLPEVLASVLYWWCPLAWYARRRLREAEELCCDAWVVWALPDAGRDYASALLETVEFVSAGIGGGGGGGRGIPARSPLPMLASGMGQFHQLRRRLVMIKHARVPRRLSGPGWLAVGALALGLLPLAPTLAQVATPVAEDVKAAPAVPADVAENVIPAAAVPASVSATPVGLDTLVTVAAGGPVPPTPAAAPPETSDTPIIEQLRSTPKAKNNRGAEENAASSYRSGEAKPDSRGQSELHNEREALRAEVRDLARQLERAQRRLADLDMAATQDLKKQAYANWKPDPRGKGVAPSSPEAGYQPYPSGTVLPPVISRAGGSANYAGGSRGQVGVTPADSNVSRERRLAEVEANLKALMDEVRALRNETPAPPTPLTKPPQK
jgi:beta-lactamase regulating signal transducer with metallopeptidase domain